MKISLSRINSILTHSEENPDADPPKTRMNELVAIDDATTAQLATAISKALISNNCGIQWVGAMTIKTKIKDQSWLIVVIKFGRDLSAKQRAAQIVIEANKGRITIIRKYSDFLAWFSSISKV